MQLRNVALMSNTIQDMREYLQPSKSVVRVHADRNQHEISVLGFLQLNPLCSYSTTVRQNWDSRFISLMSGQIKGRLNCDALHRRWERTERLICCNFVFCVLCISRPQKAVCVLDCLTGPCGGNNNDSHVQLCILDDYFITSHVRTFWADVNSAVTLSIQVYFSCTENTI